MNTSNNILIFCNYSGTYSIAYVRKGIKGKTFDLKLFFIVHIDLL